MGHDADRHSRRSIRLAGYDYRQAGIYFVTICTYQRELLFEDAVLRRVAETMWQRIPRHFPQVQLDRWVVMPNHVHGIVIIVDDPGRGEASQVIDPRAGSVPSDAIQFVDETVPWDASPLHPPWRQPPAGANPSPSPPRQPPAEANLRQRPTGAAAGSLGVIVGN